MHFDGDLNFDLRCSIVLTVDYLFFIVRFIVTEFIVIRYTPSIDHDLYTVITEGTSTCTSIIHDNQLLLNQGVLYHNGRCDRVVVRRCSLSSCIALETKIGVNLSLDHFQTI